MPRTHHPEVHRTDRIGWLRAGVLGANDGIVSTASLMIGVAAAGAGRTELMVAGVAGLVAGAMSMAAGEYVSVSSQADTEESELDREKAELLAEPEHEHRELAGIYVKRGLTPELATEVARQLMDRDALGAHARDELGITATATARPVQAAVTSAASFAMGAALPLVTALVAPKGQATTLVAGTALVFLTGLGVVAARTGGSPVFKSAVRVLILGALAMGITAGVGKLFGAAV